MVVPKDRFWAKVLFKEFIRHYRKLSDEEIVTDVKQSMDDLDDLNECGNTFGSKMVRWSLERANTPSAEASRANGSKGGRPKKSTMDASRGNSDDDCKVPPSINTFTTDADTREDSENFANTGNRATLESGTSAVKICSAKPSRGAAARPPLRNRGPTSKSEFEEFIYDPGHGINTAMAWEWFDIHSARDWTDSGGKPLNNWKGALINYCKSKD